MLQEPGSAVSLLGDYLDLVLVLPSCFLACVACCTDTAEMGVYEVPMVLQRPSLREEALQCPCEHCSAALQVRPEGKSSLALALSLSLSLSRSLSLSLSLSISLPLSFSLSFLSLSHSFSRWLFVASLRGHSPAAKTFVGKAARGLRNPVQAHTCCIFTSILNNSDHRNTFPDRG